MYSIAKLLIKLLSIYLAVDFVTEKLPLFLGLINSGKYLQPAMIIAVIATLNLVIACYLWFSADKLADYIVDKEEQSKIVVDDYAALQSIAFSVVGVFLLAFSIPDMIRFILEYFLISRMSASHQLPQLAADMIRILIGGWLLIDASSIINRIKSLTL
ncbi:MAG: hypothetical protein ACQEQI_02935 [Bacillota bacterium]